MGPPDLLVSAVAVVYDPVPAPDDLSIDTFRDFLRPPLNLYPPTDSLRVASSRDQMEVLLSPVRVEVRDLSGDIEKSRAKVAEVLTGVVGILPEPRFRSYEIDLFLESYAGEDEDVEAWLGQRFLRESLQEDLGVGVSCDNVTVTYEREDWTQTIELEAVTGSRVIIRFYSRQDITDLPDRDDLQVDVQAQHEYLSALLQKVGSQ